MSIVIDYRKSKVEGASQTMPKEFAQDARGFNPFGDLVGLTFASTESGNSRCQGYRHLVNIWGKGRVGSTVALGAVVHKPGYARHKEGRERHDN
jgi:hypothetical protein